MGVARACCGPQQPAVDRCRLPSVARINSLQWRRVEVNAIKGPVRLLPDGGQKHNKHTHTHIHRKNINDNTLSNGLPGPLGELENRPANRFFVYTLRHMGGKAVGASAQYVIYTDGRSQRITGDVCSLEQNKKYVVGGQLSATITQNAA